MPIVKLSALNALEAEDTSRESEWGKGIWELMDAVDEYVPIPERPRDQPFLMPIEDVFSIKGRGTVVTGRVERGVVEVGQTVEIVGIKDTSSTVVTGVEMFRKTLDEGEPGGRRGRPDPGRGPRRGRAWAGARGARQRYASQRGAGAGLRAH